MHPREKGMLVTGFSSRPGLLPVLVLSAAAREAAGDAISAGHVPGAVLGRRDPDDKVILAVEDGKRLLANLSAGAGQARLGEAGDVAVVGIVEVGNENHVVDHVADLGREDRELGLDVLLLDAEGDG